MNVLRSLFKKNLIQVALLVTLAACTFSAAAATVAASRDDAVVTRLLVDLDRGNGWTKGPALDAIINSYQRTRDPKYRAVIDEALRVGRGWRSGDANVIYYDDMGWYMNAWLRMYDVSGDRHYLTEAENIFKDMTTAWDGTCGGGVWWNSQRRYKNAITNELFLLGAARLARRASGPGVQQQYRDWAFKEWDWFRQSGMINGDHLVNDGLENCRNNGQATWSYNQGVILGGLVELWRINGDRGNLAIAEQIADATITRQVFGNGVLSDACDRAGDSCTGDALIFKGMFVQGLSRLWNADRNNKPRYGEFLRANADYVWNNDRTSDNRIGVTWVGPPTTLTTSTQAAGALLIGEVALLESGGETINPPNNSVTYEAETGILHNLKSESSNAGYSGSGYLAGWNKSGQWVDFEVTVPETKNYKLRFHYAGGDGNATRLLFVNGSTSVARMTFNSTGGWGNYAFTGEYSVTLKAGRNDVSVIFDAGQGSAQYLNLDSLEVGASSANTEPPHGVNFRIMPLGDSITWGIGSSTLNGYRQPLLEQLVGARNSVDFVGTQHSGTMADTDNEGRSGWIIDQIDGVGGTVAASTRPNVVLIHAGTNDLNNNVNPAGAPARLGKLLDDVIAKAPKALIVVSTLIPNGNGSVQVRNNAFNAVIPGLVKARADAGKKVVMASMGALGNADLNDGLHPNDGGYKKMADAWFSAIADANKAGLISPPEDVDTGTCSGFAGRWLDKGPVASGIGVPSSSVQLADLDGDGKADYLGVDPTTGAVTAYLNDGPGNGNVPWIWLPLPHQVASGVGSPGTSVTLADLDGDGRADYLVLDPKSGAVHAWINGGPSSDPNKDWIWYGKNMIAKGVSADPQTTVTKFADIDGDGRVDYLVVNRASGAIDAWINGGPSADGLDWVWYPQGQIATGVGTDPQTTELQFANFDCGRKADYLSVSTSSGAINAWINNGKGANGKWQWYQRHQIASGLGQSLTNGTMLKMADIDGDGRADYLLMAPNGAMRALINNGGDPE